MKKEGHKVRPVPKTWAAALARMVRGIEANTEHWRITPQPEDDRPGGATY